MFVTKWGFKTFCFIFLILILIIYQNGVLSDIFGRKRQKNQDSELLPAIDSEVMDAERAYPGESNMGSRGKRRRRRRNGRKAIQRLQQRRKVTLDRGHGNYSLVWKCGSIKGSIFNHFMQIKYMNSIAKAYNRTLVVVPVTGRESDKEREDYIDICEVFQFNEDKIVCSSNPRMIPLKCFSKMEALDRFSGLSRICFDGKLWYVAFDHIKFIGINARPSP